MAFQYNEDPRSDKLMEPCVKNRQNVSLEMTNNS